MLRKDRNRKTNRKQSRTVSAAVLAVLLAGSLACGSAASEVTELAETEAEASADAQYANVKEFLSDIEAAVNDRRAISDSYTEAELRMMTNDEIAEANQACCESERWFMNYYGNARFESRNIQYLCDQYLTGLQNQFDAYDSWKEKQDIDAYNELWEAGFSKRAVTVVELKEFYGASFTDISDMQKKADELETLDEPVKQKASEETIRKVQEDLNRLKFPVGSVDGDCGYRTVQMVRRFQKLYGYGPADGFVDEDLLAQLDEEVKKIYPEPEETEEMTETETTETEASSGETETDTEAETETEVSAQESAETETEAPPEKERQG